MASFAKDPRVLAWDTEHFGVTIASCEPDSATAVSAATAWARSERVSLLMARCSALRADVVHALECAGFRLMDSFVRYELPLSSAISDEGLTSVRVRSFAPTDVEAIRGVAQRAFAHFGGHFHNDARIPRDGCGALYEKWAVNSCRDPRVADDVVVALHDDGLCGFATLKALGGPVVEAELVAVDPRAQGRRIAGSLLTGAMRWCRKRGFSRMEIDSQLGNYAAHRVWQRVGFRTIEAGHTFHLWLDEAGLSGTPGGGYPS